MTKKFKDIVKQNPEPARGKSGTSPMDPWNAKSGLAEASEQELLHRYLKSRGINPEFIPKDTKIAHSKSSAFLSWRKSHEFDESVTLQHTPFEKRQHMLKRAKHMNKVVPAAVSSNGLHKEEIEILEAVDKEDTLTFDIPLMIRMLELAREDVKDDMELHRITERLISIRSKGVLTMDDYEFIAGIKKLKEEIEEMSKEKELKEWTLFDKIAQARSEVWRVQQLKVNEGKQTALDRFRAASATREKKHNDIEKSRQEKLHQDPSKVTVPEPKATDGMTSAIDRLEKHLNKENTLDPKAATEAPVGPGEIATEAQRQRSKSARMIKALYKSKNMKEETYDWEKDDKTPQKLDKGVKIDIPKKEANFGENKPEARIVMSGGKTMTGEKRDTVEVDPLMAKRNNTPDQFEKPNKK